MSRPGGSGLDVAVIGAGSAAFAAALRAAEEGARVTMIDDGPLGGTCVNVGCVPSKILVHAAHAARVGRHHPFDGVGRTAVPVDRPAMLAQQTARVERMRHAKYERLLAEETGLLWLRGRAAFEDPRTLLVRLADGGSRRLTPDRILIATGSTPVRPPVPGLAGTPYWTSTEALEAAELPERLIVLGGGYVALELAQAFRRLGSEVTLLARSTLLSAADPALGGGLAAVLAAEGVNVRLHTLPTAVAHRDGRFEVATRGGLLIADRLLVATGRRPATRSLRLERSGVSTDGRGAIVVDRNLRTSAPHVYAAGDCTQLPQLVYVAAAAGTRAAIHMTGGQAPLDLEVLPVVVFTDPQAAWVGMDEAEARRRGLAPEVRTLSLEEVPRALVEFDTRGFLRLVAAPDGRLLGAQILSAAAGELIHTAALALRAGLTVHDLADQLCPYLTHAEGLRLAAQTFTRDVARLSCCAG